MIIGASFDTVEEQKTFAENESFPYRLISDPDKSIGATYDAVRGPDEDFADFPRRISYLIDPDGIVVANYDAQGTDLSEHATLVLSDITSRS